MYEAEFNLIGALDTIPVDTPMGILRWLNEQNVRLGECSSQGDNCPIAQYLGRLVERPVKVGPGAAWYYNPDDNGYEYDATKVFLPAHIKDFIDCWDFSETSPERNYFVNGKAGLFLDN